jgi:hypothetical protein
MANKITEIELKQLNLLRQEVLESISVLGEIEYQQIILNLRKEEQTKAIKDLKDRENRFWQEIKDKYGEVTLNLDTGELS